MPWRGQWQIEFGRRPGRLKLTASGTFGQWALRLTVVADELGYRCAGLTIEPGPDADPELAVTTSALRSIPLARILEQIRRESAEEFNVRAVHALRGNRTTARVVAGAAGLLERAEPSGGRPKLYGRPHFEAVAEVYTEAVTRGENPRAAVAAWGQEAYRQSVTPSAAAKWVARAREMGLLGATRRGKAGGAAAPPAS